MEQFTFECLKKARKCGEVLKAEFDHEIGKGIRKRRRWWNNNSDHLWFFRLNLEIELEIIHVSEFVWIPFEIICDWIIADKSLAGLSDLYSQPKFFYK